jgi:hypothetical protein
MRRDGGPVLSPLVEGRSEGCVALEAKRGRRAAGGEWREGDGGRPRRCGGCMWTMRAWPQGHTQGRLGKGCYEQRKGILATVVDDASLRVKGGALGLPWLVPAWKAGSREIQL